MFQSRFKDEMMEELFKLKRDQGRLLREISKRTNRAVILMKGSNAVAKPRGGNHAETTRNTGSENADESTKNKGAPSGRRTVRNSTGRSHLRSKGLS